MKNLKAIAAEYSLYQAAFIPAKFGSVNIAKISKPDVPPFLKDKLPKDFEFGLFYKCETEKQSGTGFPVYFIKEPMLLLKRKDSDIILMLKKGYRSEKYDFYPYYGLFMKYQKLTHHSKDRVLADLKKPDNIGVFTVAKINKWCDYWVAHFALLEKLHFDSDVKNNQLKQKIDTFIRSVPCKVSRYNNNVTEVDTKLFTVKFTHHEDQCYLRTDITFKPDDLNEIIKIEKLIRDEK